MSTRILLPGRGRWERRGGSIVLLPPDDGDSGEVQGEVGTPVAVTATPAGVIDQRIDVFAQYALLRMAKSPDPAARADASAMLGAVKSGRLAGIYKEDEQVPALRARRVGTNWWLVIPKAEDAALFLGAAPGETPLIVFRDGVRSNAARLDPALRKAWASFVAIGAAGGVGGRCRLATGGGAMAELGAPAGAALANVVPPVLCQAVPSKRPVARLRLSVWADPRFVTPHNLAGARGILDDVSLLRTVTNDRGPAGPLRLSWDPRFLPGASDDARTEAFRRMVVACHAQGVQALAGYGIVDGPDVAAGDRFNAWLRAGAARAPTIAAYARRIVGFLSSLSPRPGAPALAARERFDGISLDVETLAGDVGDAMTEFCRELARQLDGRGMFLAVAAGGMISETHAFQNPPNPATGKRPAPVPALASARATRYGMALGMPNLIIRPMAYDAPLSGAGLALWHAEIIDFALQRVGLRPSQLQLGVKTVHGGLDQGITGRPGQVVARCREPLRPRRVGLAVFALGGAERWVDWDAYDRALNLEHGALSPGAIGQPLQAPLDPRALARLTPALPPGSRAPVRAPRFTSAR